MFWNILQMSFWTHCVVCVSADIGWWTCRFRKRLSVAEPACVWVDQSAGLSLADGHEYGPVHSRVHSKGRGRSAALTAGQWQVKGELLVKLGLYWIHAEIPPESFSHGSSGPRRFEPKWPVNHQEEAEGPAEGSGKAGETEREKREGGATQRQTTAQQRLCLLRDPMNSGNNLFTYPSEARTLTSTGTNAENRIATNVSKLF